MVEVLIIVLGVISTGVSAQLCRRFWRAEHPLAKRIALMTAAGTLVGICTLVFSTATFLGFYAQIPDWAVNLLRIVIFVPLTLADLWMHRKLTEIEGSET